MVDIVIPQHVAERRLEALQEIDLDVGHSPVYFLVASGDSIAEVPDLVERKIHRRDVVDGATEAACRFRGIGYLQVGDNPRSRLNVSVGRPGHSRYHLGVPLSSACLGRRRLRQSIFPWTGGTAVIQQPGTDDEAESVAVYGRVHPAASAGRWFYVCLDPSVTHEELSFDR